MWLAQEGNFNLSRKHRTRLRLVPHTSPAIEIVRFLPPLSQINYYPKRILSENYAGRKYFRLNILSKNEYIPEDNLCIKIFIFFIKYSYIHNIQNLLFLFPNCFMTDEKHMNCKTMFFFHKFNGKG